MHLEGDVTVIELAGWHWVPVCAQSPWHGAHALLRSGETRSVERSKSAAQHPVSVLEEALEKCRHCENADNFRKLCNFSQISASCSVC